MPVARSSGLQHLFCHMPVRGRSTCVVATEAISSLRADDRGGVTAMVAMAVVVVLPVHALCACVRVHAWVHVHA
jgi:hypothetical protein